MVQRTKQTKGFLVSWDTSGTKIVCWYMQHFWKGSQTTWEEKSSSKHPIIKVFSQYNLKKQYADSEQDIGKVDP